MCKGKRAEMYYYEIGPMNNEFSTMNKANEQENKGGWEGDGEEGG